MMRYVFFAALFSVDTKTEPEATMMVNKYLRDLPNGVFVLDAIHSDGISDPPFNVLNEVTHSAGDAFLRSVERNGWPAPIAPKSKKKEAA